MYAIFINGGKQYKAKKGKYLILEKINKEKGSKIILKNILMIKKKKKIFIGKPILLKSLIKATIISHNKKKKIQIIKFKRRKHYKKKQGHRQPYTKIQINNIINKI
ncbi:50S ribosomal protein L21 [Buchnera aphidicola]|uniref:50S ribosomal protein L21 n=1 Tax=Buchnera aphidicola TaxID=9 RepID=UPI0031B8816E